MITKYIEKIIFNLKWILIPFYIKLGWTLAVLLYVCILHRERAGNQLLVALEDLDITMIANLIRLGITGSYHSFVSKDHGYPHENISSGTLKIKISTSLIGVASIYLLRSFLDGQGLSLVIWKQIIIFMAFLLGGLAQAIIDNIHVKSEAIAMENEKNENKVILDKISKKTVRTTS